MRIRHTHRTSSASLGTAHPTRDRRYSRGDAEERACDDAEVAEVA
jgi:hypothetical protein